MGQKVRLNFPHRKDFRCDQDTNKQNKVSQLLAVMVQEIPPEPKLRWDIYPFPFCVQDKYPERSHFSYK